MPTHIPYSIPFHRELNANERALLNFLVEREAPAHLGEIDDVKVAARCGCGKYPTILLRRGEAATPPPTAPARELASYRGLNAEGVTVGVVLLERNGELAELEAWSPEGADITSWPAVSNLQRFPPK